MAEKIDKKKKFIISSIIGILIICGISFFTLKYYRSTEYLEKKMVQAIKDNDLDTVEKLCPKFTNGKTISKDAYRLYLSSFSKNASTKSIQKELQNKDQFKVVNGQKLLAKKSYQAKARSIDFTGIDQETTVSLVNSKKDIHISAKDKHQLPNLIAKNYGKLQITYHNKDLGFVKENVLVNLANKNLQDTEKTTDVYRKSKSFQQTILNDITSFLTSWNDSVSNNLNFDNMSHATDEATSELRDIYNLLKELLASYENKFDTVALRTDNLHITHYDSTGYEVECDVITNREQKLELKDIDDLELSEDERKLDSKEGTARIKLVYDRDKKQFLVKSFDFSVYQQNMGTLRDKVTKTLPEPSIGHWSDSQNAI